MASIYKPTRRDKATGKLRKYAHYRIAYKDEHGRRVTVLGYKDKAATEAKARDIERTIERKKAGVPEPAKDQKRLTSDAITAYLDELVRRGSDRKGSHVTENDRQLTALREQCNWNWLTEISARGVAAWLAEAETLGMAPRTRNHYQSRLKAFLKWCVEQGWLATNPLAVLKLARVGQKGRKRLRRAYTREEFQRLLAVAPRRREPIYLVAALSGLRRKELAQLTPADIDMAGRRWTLRPEITKNGQAANIPMLAECQKAILDGIDMHTVRWEPGKPIFKAIPAAHILAADLKVAKIERQDASGRWLDFHSFRYFFCSQLGRILPIQQVKVLMRHSTIKLTADLYMDLGIDDIAEAALQLPPLLLENQPESKADAGQKNGKAKVAKGAKKGGD